MNFHRVVVATDFSEESLSAMETAFDLTLEHANVVFLVHVIEPFVPNDPIGGLHPSVLAMNERALEELKALVPENREGDAEIQTTVLCDASPSKAIACFAREENADLIVVGTHGRTGLTRMLMGSTAESLLRYSPCQVLVVKCRRADTRAA